MKYISTRGGITPVSFCDAIMMGLADDGGLLLPESIPQVTMAEVNSGKKLAVQYLARAYHFHIGRCHEICIDLLCRTVSHRRFREIFVRRAHHAYLRDFETALQCQRCNG